MAVPVTRLTNTGTLYTVGQFDEASLDLSSRYQKNLLAYSQTFSNASWSQNNCFLYPTNSVLAPDGTPTAYHLVDTADVSSNYHSLRFTGGLISYVPYQTYTFSCYVKAAELSTLSLYQNGSSSGARLYLNTLTTTNDSGVTSTIVVALPNGWYRFANTFTLPANAGSYIAIYLDNPDTGYIGAGGNGIYIWGPQLEIGSVATEYEPTGSTGFVAVPQGFTTRTDATGVYTIGSFDEVSINPISGINLNLIKDSTQMNNYLTGGWIGPLNAGEAMICDPTTQVLAPDGTQTAYKLYAMQHGQTYYSYLDETSLPGFPPLGARVTLSIYAQAAEFTNFQMTCYACGNANFNLLTGQVTSTGSNTSTPTVATMVNAGNGWWRCCLTVTENWAPYDQMNFYFTGFPGVSANYVGDGHSGVYVWGPQFEIGSSATNYVPTGDTGAVSKFVQRIDNTGLHRVAGQYDEVTGIVATTNGLAMNIDFAFPQCYSGSGYIVTDMTGNGVNFTYNNQANQFPLYDGTSFYFNGINFQALCTNTISYPAIETQAFSIEVWINPTILNTQQTGGDGNIIAIRENYAVSGFRFGLETPNSLTTDTTAGPVFFCGESGGTLTIRTSTNSSYPISLGKWAQVVVTYDGISTANMYVNGAFAISAQGGYRPPTRATGNSNYFFIGGPEEGTKPMNGKIGVVRWYNRPLLASEVVDNFNGLRHRYGL